MTTDDGFNGKWKTRKVLSCVSEPKSCVSVAGLIPLLASAAEIAHCRTLRPLGEHFRVMLLDECLNHGDIAISERPLRHHTRRPVCQDEELGRAGFAKSAVHAGMNVHGLHPAMARKVKPMSTDFLRKVLWHVRQLRYNGDSRSRCDRRSPTRPRPCSSRSILRTP